MQRERLLKLAIHMQKLLKKQNEIKKLLPIPGFSNSIPTVDSNTAHIDPTLELQEQLQIIATELAAIRGEQTDLRQQIFDAQHSLSDIRSLNSLLDVTETRALILHRISVRFRLHHSIYLHTKPMLMPMNG